MKSFLILFTLAAAVCAQPAIAPPQVGFFEDGTNSFRPVFGIAGNFFVAGPALAGVVSATYSGSFGLVKTANSIITTDNQGNVLATMNAPSGWAAFAFQKDGSPAFAYVPSENLLLEWFATGFQTVPFDARLFPAGAVRAIFVPDSVHVGFLVQRLDGLWDIRVLLETGECDSQAAITGVRGTALILSSGELIYVDRNGVVVRETDGSEVHILGPIPQRSSMTQMGAGWVTLTDSSSGAQYAIRVTTGREGFYSLPEVSQ